MASEVIPMRLLDFKEAWLSAHIADWLPHVTPPTIAALRAMAPAQTQVQGEIGKDEDHAEAT